MRRVFLQVFLGVASWASLGYSQTPAKQLTTDEIRKLLQEKKTFFLDVREPKELEELGTIKGYVNIPLSELEKRLKEIPKDALVVTV